MEHYRKGSNIEEEFVKEKLPIPNLPADFLWMQVNGGTKIHNVIDYAKKALKNKEATHVVWSSCGGGVTKAITCAEIIKRDFKDFYQVTKLCQKKIDEIWDPIIKDLDPIIVTRKIPAIHILLTPDPVTNSVLGVQAPNDPDAFWKENSTRRGKQIKQTPKKDNKNKAGTSKTDESKESHKKRQRSETEGSNQTNSATKPQRKKKISNAKKQAFFQVINN